MQYCARFCEVPCVFAPFASDRHRPTSPTAPPCCQGSLLSAMPTSQTPMAGRGCIAAWRRVALSGAKFDNSTLSGPRGLTAMRLSVPRCDYLMGRGAPTRYSPIPKSCIDPVIRFTANQPLRLLHIPSHCRSERRPIRNHCSLKTTVSQDHPVPTA